LTQRSNYIPSETKKKESPRRVKVDTNILSSIHTKENTPIDHNRLSGKQELMMRVIEESRNNKQVPMNTESVETYGDMNIISDLDMTNEGKR
jgi:hypothetical protein